MRITIKIGSNVLTRADGSLDVTRLSALVDQIAVLRQQGIEVLLVSSGAVACGRSVLHSMKNLKTKDNVDERQLFSAVGQAKLIDRYYELFRDHRIHVGQVLTMKQNFSTPISYSTQQNCMEVMLENGVIPIINENDTVCVTELMFTDNDELSGLVARMMNCDHLIILSNIDGIFTGNPEDTNSELITHVKPGDDLSRFIQSKKSNAGRGGMESKYNIAQEVNNAGITVIIANGKRNNVLTDLLIEHKTIPCTIFENHQ